MGVPWGNVVAVGLALAVAVLAPAAEASVPDPLERGRYAVTRVDPFRAGVATLHEPDSAGGPATGAASPIALQVRGSLYRPAGRRQPSPLIVLVHGNHASCDEGEAPDCAIFKRNDAGYAYLAENLASWGYVVASLDQDQLMARQDGPKGKGMHQRRLLLAALLDALHEANERGLPVDADSNLGDSLVGRLDLTRIGLMGHSRGGDAVSSFLDYNRMRPEPGRRYPIRGVISLAPVDYERRAPYGTPYMTVLPYCDGDVSNLQGARMFERGQYRDDPFPRIQSSQLGANHNWYNTVWFADGQDGAEGADSACRDTQPNHIRLSGEAYSGAYVIANADKGDPEVDTRVSGDPARMGDQERIGLATMAAFLRRYVGGEGAFDPYMTGELSARGDGLQIPASACPTGVAGARIACAERVSTSYVAPPGERRDVIRPEAENALGLTALGTPLRATGFANPYRNADGTPRNTGWEAPGDTPGGAHWCNPEPLHFAPEQLGLPYGDDKPPLAARPCPLPALSDLGSQAGTRERSPINHAYGRQLALAWDGPARLAARIPAGAGDVRGFKALALAAGIGFFDGRNPRRTGTDAEWDPALTTQDFAIALTDARGRSAAVAAGDPRYGNALHQTTGSETRRVHIVLNQIRVPLRDFAHRGVDLSAVRELELRFGEREKPSAGSIQLADVRFQEATRGTDVLVDTTRPGAGPATGPPRSGPDPAALLAAYDRAPGEIELPESRHNRWIVDDDRAECPGAEHASIQAAVDMAAPWDTIVVCPGVYEERSGSYFGVPFPAHHAGSPVAPGATNGVTISKPLRIKGAGAAKVTIRPHPSLGASLSGASPDPRDGAGNVIAISRQSLGSTDDNEHFVDISGVTVESPGIHAEAGVAFFNASGRISGSMVDQGVAMTNSLLGSGSGTVERQVTVDRSRVDGGVLFDASRDGETPSGIVMRGYVTDSEVRGGVRHHAGATGFVRGRLDGDVTVADGPPAGAIVDPGAGARVAVGQRVEPVVAASDDVAVRSVTLTANGRPVATLDRAPYAFAWTPRRADAGRHVTLRATIADSAGQTAESALHVRVRRRPHGSL